MEQSRLNIRGFSLIELITVLVILGIVAAIGSNFVVTTVDSYNTTQTRSKLVQKGRLTLEQMTRQLRTAVPNAVRVSGSGNCIEYFATVGGANYLSPVADSENGAPAIASINTVPFNLGLGSANHVIIGALSAAEVYTTAVPAARVSVGALGAEPLTNVPLASSHIFIRNSINRRLFLADNPARFCISGGNLLQYTNYGLDTGILDDLDPGGTTTIMGQNIAAAGSAFVLSPGTEDRNTGININLTFTQDGEQVTLNHQVLVRNVP